MNPNTNPSSTNHRPLLNKRADKKSINIKWNSGLYFRIGLIVSLLLSWIAIESHWDLKPELAVYDPGKHIVDNIIPTEFTIETPKVKTVQKNIQEIDPPKRQLVQPTSTFTAIDDISNKSESKFAATSSESDDVIKAPIAPKPTKTTPVNTSIMSVQTVPIYPGCESLNTNEERRDCLNSKINAFISKRFDVDKFSEKYVGTKNRIDVVFTINSQGIITNVSAKSKYSDLAKEAESVIQRIPKMIPGKQKGQSVNVQMYVPVIFNVEN